MTLSLEAKLHLLHSYMNVKWITLPCDTQVERPGGFSFLLNYLPPPFCGAADARASSGLLSLTLLPQKARPMLPAGEGLGVCACAFFLELLAPAFPLPAEPKRGPRASAAQPPA